MIVAIAALVMAMGGTAVAGRALIGTKDIKNGAVTKKKLASGAVPSGRVMFVKYTPATPTPLPFSFNETDFLSDTINLRKGERLNLSGSVNVGQTDANATTLTHCTIYADRGGTDLGPIGVQQTVTMEKESDYIAIPLDGTLKATTSGEYGARIACGFVYLGPGVPGVEFVSGSLQGYTGQ